MAAGRQQQKTSRGKGSIDKKGSDQETFAPPFSLSETINFTHKTLKANGIHFAFFRSFFAIHIKVWALATKRRWRINVKRKFKGGRVGVLGMRKCNYSGSALKFHTGLETEDNVRMTQTETEVSSSWMSGTTENGRDGKEWDRERKRRK